MYQIRIFFVLRIIKGIAFEKLDRVPPGGDNTFMF